MKDSKDPRFANLQLKCHLPSFSVPIPEPWDIKVLLLAWWATRVPSSNISTRNPSAACWSTSRAELWKDMDSTSLSKGLSPNCQLRFDFRMSSSTSLTNLQKAALGTRRSGLEGSWSRWISRSAMKDLFPKVYFHQELNGTLPTDP